MFVSQTLYCWSWCKIVTAVFLPQIPRLFSDVCSQISEQLYCALAEDWQKMFSWTNVYFANSLLALHSLSSNRRPFAQPYISFGALNTKITKIEIWHRFLRSLMFEDKTWATRIVWAKEKPTKFPEEFDWLNIVMDLITILRASDASGRSLHRPWLWPAVGGTFVRLQNSSTNDQHLIST